MSDTYTWIHVTQLLSYSGSVCSCVGPIIDVQMKVNVFELDKLVLDFLIGPVVSLIARDIPFPTIYDAMLIVRPLCNFKDGTVIRNTVVILSAYLSEVLFSDSYLLGFIHLLPIGYYSRYSSCQIRCKTVD